MNTQTILIFSVIFLSLLGTVTVVWAAYGFQELRKQIHYLQSSVTSLSNGQADQIRINANLIDTLTRKNQKDA